MAANSVPPTTLITTKLLYNGSIRRFKIYLKDCGANTLPGKLKELLAIPEADDVVFERWSDSAAAYILLDSNKPAVYKQLYRAAKAKAKLRIKVTTSQAPRAEPLEANNNSAETLLPSYSATTLNPPTAIAESITSVSIPLEKVSEAVVAYLEGEEGRSKLRSCIGEEVEKEIEKRSLAQSVANVSPIAEATPPKPNMRQVVVKQVYAVYCNICAASADNVHYHCGTCDNGDFDLCEKCVDEGKHCDGAEHWMIKRTIVNGEVISSRELIASTTAIVAKKSEILNQKEEEKEEPKVEDAEDVYGRTCNCCCEDFDDSNFVECTVCPDYDLCLECLVKQNHGHDPSHGFKAATGDTVLSPHLKSLLSPGKNFRHFAICDGCDKQIYGVRYKCFNCPDWDYCSTCYKSVNTAHPGHRFAPLYDGCAQLLFAPTRPQHFGVYCDGPHCSSKGFCSWIVGDRYKCAICPDFDICGTCEASPVNKHNSTHPFIKFKSPVRSVTVQTLDAETSVRMGDRDHGDMRSVTSSVITNASTSVQTIAEVKPTDESASSTASLMSAKAENAEKPEESKEEVKVKQEEMVELKEAQEEVQVEEQKIEQKENVTEDQVEEQPKNQEEQKEEGKVEDAEIVEKEEQLEEKEVKVVESKLEEDVADLITSRTSQMIFPTLDKESPVPSASSSSANIADAPVTVSKEEVPSTASTSPAANEDNIDDDVISEVYSVDELDDELENFISDDEDYEVWDASDDEEFGSSANSSTA